MRDDLERRIAESLDAVRDKAKEERAPRRMDARLRVVSRSRRHRRLVWAGTAVAATAIVAVMLVTVAITRPDAERGPERNGGFADQVTTFVEVGRHPFDLVVSAGVVWVTDTERGVLHRIDAATTTIIDSIPIAGRPEDIDIRDGIVWVTNPESGSVHRFSEQTGEPIGDPIVFAERPIPLEMAVGGGAAWILVEEQGLYKIDSGSGEEMNSHTLLARDVAIGEGTVWALGLAGELIEIDSVTAAPVRTVPTTAAPGSDLVAGGGAVWIADPSTGTVTKYSIDTLETLGSSPIEGRYLDMTLGEGVMWVLSNDGGTPIVSGISVATGTPSGIVLQVEGDPQQISESDGVLWVTDPGEATVARVVPGTEV